MRCLCGADDCRSCGPAQGIPWCLDHNQSSQYCCKNPDKRVCAACLEVFHCDDKGYTTQNGEDFCSTNCASAYNSFIDIDLELDRS